CNSGEVGGMADGQARPERKAADRSDPRPGGEMRGQQSLEVVEGLQVLRPPPLSNGRRMLEQPQGNELTDDAAAQVERRLHLAQLADDLSWAADPTNPQPAPEQLAERPDREDRAARREGRHRRRLLIN